ncbi:MAG: hypothetical protein HY235_24050 [Acidobacteria bacterium]|nr:hypothetical protein [Acidobacteriota bacterium]
MLAALLLTASLADWVPARWPANDPASLDLLQGTPVNCLLLEQKLWSGAFVKKAREKNVTVLGVLRPGGGAARAVGTAREQGLAGIVLEGDFPEEEAEASRQAAVTVELALVELPSRRGIRFHGNAPVLGTYQGLWPGIRPTDDKGKAHAMPSGAPWIDTNAGFLRYARAMHGGGFWVANLPPTGQILPLERYFQAIADAAMLGGRWVVALDEDFASRLIEREPAAVRDWKRIARHLQFYEEYKEARRMPPYGQMAVVQDASSGALLSGSVLDMITVKHTPVRPVPGVRLSQDALGRATMAVNVDPEALSPQQKEALRGFTRSGGTVLNGPPGWKMPATSKDNLTVDEDAVEKLDQIWKEMNTMIGRRNLGVRLFNVSSMLSYLQASPDGGSALLHLVNYSGYPVENVTAHVLGKYSKAWLVTPEGGRKAIEPYSVEEGAGTGLDLDLVPACAMVLMEAAR